jgi:hypothetical protein
MNVRDSENHFEKHNPKKGQSEPSETMTRTMEQMRSFRRSVRLELEKMKGSSKTSRKRKGTEMTKFQVKQRKVTTGPDSSTATNPTFTEAVIATDATGYSYVQNNDGAISNPLLLMAPIFSSSRTMDLSMPYLNFECDPSSSSQNTLIFREPSEYPVLVPPQNGENGMSI